MKILAVADSHGSPVPLVIARENVGRFDKIVFLGDFFDHEDEEYCEQKRNFLNTMDFKKRHGGKVSVLLGNHDANYLLPNMRKWQPEHADEIKSLIVSHLPLLEIFFVDKKWLFSHAGVSGVWLSNFAADDADIFFAQTNADFHSGDFSRLAFCGTDGYGDEVTQNPLWIRPYSLQKSALLGFNQAVGHTALSDSERVKKSEGGDTLLFLDSEPFLRNVYAEIDTDEDSFEIKKFARIWGKF